MKVLAINLPAYHQIPENDKWWGKGFTEWDNVRGGKKIYRGHYQPVIPLSKNYYDLSRKEDILKQIKLAKKYNIYGFIYYHYWFGNGKTLFERPVEILRKEITEEFHYCFCWANDDWITTWHGLEPKTLIEQKYMGIDDWVEHYNYWNVFFGDKRYIKIDNKPVMFIYQPHKIPDYDEMVEYFDNRAKQDGYNGIYMIECISSKCRDLHSTKSSAVYEFEPHYTCFFDISKVNLFKRYLCKKFKTVDFQSYDNLWKLIIKRQRTYNGKTIFKGCFSGWDNSARKGKNCMIVYGKTPEKFRKYFKKFIEFPRKDASTEYCIINAWNEWSECAYLEPDEKEKYKYLETIRDISLNS